MKQLRSEGQDVVSVDNGRPQAKASGPATSSLPAVKMEPVHLRTEEKITLTMQRNGGLDNMELHGLVTLRITDEKFGKIKIQMDNKDARGAQIQTHPNLDKKAFQSGGLLTLKNLGKPFPVNNDVGVLKWRFQSTAEEHIPLQINCWPNESGQGCDVNIDYSLEVEDLELKDVVIYIPLPSGVNPVIGDYDGEYRHDRPKSTLEWRIPLIDKKNSSGSMEFTTLGGHQDHFFPIRVSFISQKLFCDIAPQEVLSTEDESPVKFSQEATLFVEKYEVV